MKKKLQNLNRRDFLKKSTQTTAALLSLSGCTGLNSYFKADRTEFDKEVFIIGAGAAGLMAAHTLKKNRIPFRLFEASSRPGGRLYSVQADDSTALELGAEFFEAHQKIVFELLKEFQIDWTEQLVDLTVRPLWQSSAQEILSEIEYQKLSQAFINRFLSDRIKIFGSSENYQVLSPALAKELDNLSFHDYLQTHWINPDDRVLRYWDVQNRTQFSSDSKSISTLQVLWHQPKDQKLKSLFRVQGGWSQLVRRMYERVAGVIPNHLVKMNWSLQSLNATRDGFRCLFKNPEGIQTLYAKNIILATPMNQLKKISGVMSLEISQSKKDRIQSARLGESSKAFALIHNQPVQNLQVPALWYQDQTQYQFLKGENRSWLGGLRGGELTQWSLPDMENWKASFIDRFNLDQTMVAKSLDYHVMNWKDQIHIQGARSQWEPGSWLSGSMLFDSSDYGGRLQWAGEYAYSNEKGTVSSALESGKKAAEGLIGLLDKVV